jgi:hypothetical protein
VKVGDGIDKSKWVNRAIRGGRMHTGVYKHPDYCGRCGDGQDDLWADWVDRKDTVSVDESNAGSVNDVGILCYEEGPMVTDMMAGAIDMNLENYIESDVSSDNLVEMTAEMVENVQSGSDGGGGGGGGGGGDDDIGDDNHDQVLKEY